MFFLLLLVPACAKGTGTRTDSDSARAGLQLRPLATDVKCLGLLQAEALPGRFHGYTEEESIDAERKEEEEAKEEKIVEKIKEEGVFLVGQQSVRRQLLFGTAALKLSHAAGNHSDITSGSLQPISQSQMSSSGSALDANRTIAFGPFSSNGSWFNLWIGFGQLKASLHSLGMVAFQHTAVACMDRLGLGSILPWMVLAALLLVAVLVCVYVEGKGTRSNAGTISGTIQPPKEASASSFPPRMSCRSSTFRHTNPTRPQTTHSLLAPRASPSVLPTTVLSLPNLPEALEAADDLCPQLVVPRDCETCLRIHINKSMNSFNVLDIEGNTVLCAEPQIIGKTVLRCFDRMLAQCVTTPVNGEANEMHLLRANGGYFAKLAQGGLEGLMHCPNHEELSVTWAIWTHAGVPWFFLGDCDSSVIEVRDKRGRLVASAHKIQITGARDPPGDVDKAYLLRVGSQMDVSVVFFGILAVNRLL